MLARCASSGLTQSEFCKREGLNTSNFSWWKREIALRDAEGTGNGRAHSDEDPRITSWRRIIAKFNAGDMSKDEFCKAEDIKPAAFIWWRGELARRDAKKKHVSRSMDRAVPAPAPFIPVRPEPQHATSSRSGERLVVAEMTIAGGMIRIYDGASVSSLIALFKALREVAR